MAMNADHGISPTDLLLHVAGATARDGERLLARFGASIDWRSRSTDEWMAAGLAPRLTQRLKCLLAGPEPEREAERCERDGVLLVSWRHADYPAALRVLHRPPVLLSVRGRWPPPSPALAMVGARAATAYGRSAACRLAGATARAGVGLVSGLARGIDRFAMEAALDAGGHVVAVLGNGLRIAHPRENRALQDRIAQEGTLISEFPLLQRPDRWTFPRRNRIIAALSVAVLVVEAGRRSGALITAAHGLELGLEVWAVPGPIDSPTSEGANRLLRDGAAPVLDEQGLLRLLLGESAAQGNANASTRDPDPLLAVLGQRTLTGDQLAAELDQSIGKLRARLMALELEGRVAGLPGDRWTARGRG